MKTVLIITFGLFSEGELCPGVLAVEALPSVSRQTAGGGALFEAPPANLVL